MRSSVKIFVAVFVLVFKTVDFVSAAPVLFVETTCTPTFNDVRIRTNGSEFFPSFNGGVSVISKGRLYHPWSEGIKFTLMNKVIEGKYIRKEWIMYKSNDFYYHYEISYSLSANKMKIRIKDLGRIEHDTLPKDYAAASALYLDRCENAKDPHIIGVPYLTTFNLLLANDCFVSLYFDWNTTNASRIVPYNTSYSPNSVYFSQCAFYDSLTNGKRNVLDETIYIKVSNEIDSVFPDLSNPISKYMRKSSETIVFDDWDDMSNIKRNIVALSNAGIRNIWHIIHNVQRSANSPVISFYNQSNSDKSVIKEVSEFDDNAGYLFSVHENYCEMFSKSTEFDKSVLSLGSDDKYIFNWYDDASKDTSYLIKPALIFKFLRDFSKGIHDEYNTNSTFHDVSSSYDPSKFVDYDYRTAGAGKFSVPFNIFKSIPDTLRCIHNGPVSGEGLAHFLYVGYYDDISSAQIHTAKSLPGSYGTETMGGLYKPLLVNFDLLKMKEKTMVHGVGYYERFFYKDTYWKYDGRSKDSALMYTATELAYGHGAFVPKTCYDYVAQGLIEYNFVYPIQLRYFNSKIKSILYYDKDRFLNASDYLRKYPDTFDNFYSEDFMGQVIISYENGTIIYVNRKPNVNWTINLSAKRGFYSLHAIFENTDSLFAGFGKFGKLVLPSSNGWLCYSPK